jgi:hypothetical protein
MGILETFFAAIAVVIALVVAAVVAEITAIFCEVSEKGKPK